MNVFAHIADKLNIVLDDLFPDLEARGVARDRITVEPPRDASHGDISTNAAMILAKPLKQKPRDIAELIQARLQDDSEITNAEIAGPGFINLTLATSLWQEVVKSVLQQGADFGKTDIGKGEKVNVEFVSANPTGPMHVGHVRGAVFGDALASIMEFVGYDVSREYYINDAGGQVDQLARAVHWRYREALGKVEGKMPEGLYPGDYLLPLAKELATEHGDTFVDAGEADWLEDFKQRALDAMMDMIRADLKSLNIEHDHFFSEKSLHGQDGTIVQTLDWLRGQGLIYQGTLPPPKGKLPDEWEDREQTLFRAEQFGDDTDRALVKSNGDFTYFAADIAYHRDKYLRGFNHQIDVLGADHGGYVKRLKAAVKAVSNDEADLDVRLCQIVRLMREGEPIKMSKRSGNLITLRELVDEVGPDATRFMMLYRRNDAMLDFDYAKVVDQTRENPVFYVQYAHARSCSVFRNAKRDMPDLDISPAALKAASLADLSDPAEIELIKVLAQFPRIIALAASAHEPHRLAFYLYQLAGAFHSFWTKGKESPELRFININNETITIGRLAMVEAVRTVLGRGLDLLGVSAPSQLS